MKRIIAFLLSMVVVLFLTACGNNGDKKDNVNKTSNPAEQSNTVEETEQTPMEKVDIPESLLGTWYITPVDSLGNTTSETISTEISSFEIKQNGIITVKGKDYPLTKENLNSNTKVIYLELDRAYNCYKSYTIETEEGIYGLYVELDNDNPAFIVLEPIETKQISVQPIYSKTKYIIKETELTLNNWKDYFEIRDDYRLVKDAWKDVEGIQGALFVGSISAKNMIVLSVENGYIDYNYNIEETSLIHFDKKTDKKTYSDIKKESIESNSQKGEISFAREEGGYRVYASPFYSINLEYPGNDIENKGDEYTVRLATNAKIEVKEISGTVKCIIPE